jgi:hypothetical protein
LGTEGFHPGRKQQQGTRLAHPLGMNFEFEHLRALTPFELAEGQHLLGGGAEDHVKMRLKVLQEPGRQERGANLRALQRDHPTCWS